MGRGNSREGRGGGGTARRHAILPRPAPAVSVSIAGAARGGGRTRGSSGEGGAGAQRKGERLEERAQRKKAQRTGGRLEGAAVGEVLDEVDGVGRFEEAEETHAPGVPHAPHERGLAPHEAELEASAVALHALHRHRHVHLFSAPVLGTLGAPRLQHLPRPASAPPAPPTQHKAGTCAPR